MFVINCLFYGGVDGPGVSVCHKTGEMVLNQVAQDLDALKLAFEDLVNQAYSKFNDPLGNPDHTDAIMEFLAYLSGRGEEVWADLESPYDRDKAA